MLALTTRAGLLLALGLAGCDNAYPEVVVVNTTDEHVLLRDVSFNGCLWSGVLAYGEATSPQRCPPGSDRAHFKKFDAAKYCEQQAEAGTLDGICPCDGGVVWFNYQTISEHEAKYGEFQRIELKLTDMEQDFSIPGPYGH